jgi:hypothetical protein
MLNINYYLNTAAVVNNEEICQEQEKKNSNYCPRNNKCVQTDFKRNCPLTIFLVFKFFL